MPPPLCGDEHALLVIRSRNSETPAGAGAPGAADEGDEGVDVIPEDTSLLPGPSDCTKRLRIFATSRGESGTDDDEAWELVRAIVSTFTESKSPKSPKSSKIKKTFSENYKI